MPSIGENQEKSNSMAILAWKQRIYVLLALVLTAASAFGLGRLNTIIKAREPIKIVQKPVVQPVDKVESNVSTKQTQAGQYVAAKTGKVYYLPWCGGVNRIKEANKVWFGSKIEAEKAGYSPAANCSGL